MQISDRKISPIREPKDTNPVCELCGGTGWIPVTRGPDRRVKRCDCQIRARAATLLGAIIAAAVLTAVAAVSAPVRAGAVRRVAVAEAYLLWSAARTVVVAAVDAGATA